MESSESAKIAGVSRHEQIPPRFYSRAAGATVRGLSYLLLALWCSWPLARDVTQKLPIGSEGVATVPLFNAWTVWWNATWACQLGVSYWDAPIFYPTPRTFAFSEAQPTTLVVAPVYWLTGNVPLAYNLYLLLNLMLNGWWGERWLRTAGMPPLLGWIGGLMIVTLPFVWWQLGVLQLTMLWGILATWTYSWLLTQRACLTHAVGCGLALGMTYLGCNYYGLFLALTLPTALAAAARRDWLSWRFVGHWLIALQVAGCLCLPTVWIQWQVKQEHLWERTWSEIVALSAKMRDYTDAPWTQWLQIGEWPHPERANIWVLGCGWLKTLAAVASLFTLWRATPERRWRLAVMVWVAQSWWWSLGAHGTVAGITPYHWLYQFVPGMAQIRSPYRFAVFVQIGIVGLALSTLWELSRTLHRWVHTLYSWRRDLDSDGNDLMVPDKHQAGRWFLQHALLLVGGLGLWGETLPGSQHDRLVRVPLAHELPPWVLFLRDETPSSAAVVTLPFVKGSEVQDYEAVTWNMWWSMYHRHPLLEGYSGYFPDSFVWLKSELTRFPREAVPRLQLHAARYAVVHREALEAPEKLLQHQATSGWRWIFSDETQRVDVYELPVSPDLASSENFNPALSQVRQLE
ncbi:MAG: hypothetical protein KatS3mg113_1034 [Planctomycetaceae bacterium]|nr:MAG: hypothetical protein KatS3mg113_1034 [Planctomycetaceae bacterium]